MSTVPRSRTTVPTPDSGVTRPSLARADTALRTVPRYLVRRHQLGECGEGRPRRIGAVGDPFSQLAGDLLVLPGHRLTSSDSYV
ncbi:hypothetical protein Ae717Ps2_6844c [Pseudonocardia sp. Ae717_Ps2]|nr:hypothetical protein Ae717Ps2_6844c [Pseudonocardia sp. Ae717_Ps2]